MSPLVNASKLCTVIPVLSGQLFGVLKVRPSLVLVMTILYGCGRFVPGSASKRCTVIPVEYAQLALVQMAKLWLVAVMTRQ